MQGIARFMSFPAPQDLPGSCHFCAQVKVTLQCAVRLSRRPQGGIGRKTWKWHDISQEIRRRLQCH
jgi:hypothetical protein